MLLNFMDFTTSIAYQLFDAANSNPHLGGHQLNAAPLNVTVVTL